jgi:hypothetical protein
MTSNTAGRVTDDGTVYVTRPDGEEVSVGQWAAGAPEDGLAFYRRKYDGLRAEADLLMARLADGKAAPDSAATFTAKLRETAANPNVVGDLAALAAIADQIDAAAVTRREAVAKEREARRAEVTAKREAIVAEAEQLADSTQWKTTGERFKELQTQWSALPRGDRAARESEQELWKRFSAARSAFDRTRRNHFSALDSQRKEATAVKEELIRQAVELSTSTEWNDTARAYRSLMDQWKAAPRASRADEDKLWARFRAAQDDFFNARTAAMTEREGDLRENLVAKEALVAEAEALLPIKDIGAARAALRSIGERWSAIGHVPRADRDGLESRLKRVEDAAKRYEDDHWRRTDPAKLALAQSTAATFAASLAKLETQLAAAEAAGNTRKASDLAARVEQTKSLLAAAERSVAEYGG